MIVSTPSGGVEVGESWNATLQFPIATDPQATPVPRHPEIVFTHLASDVKRRFSAEPTRRRGVLRARVVLPKAGTWRVYVWAYEMGAVAPQPTSRQIVVRTPGRN